jgi:hypothetical protein
MRGFRFYLNAWIFIRSFHKVRVARVLGNRVYSSGYVFKVLLMTN